MTDLTAPGRLYHPDDHVVMEVDIEDCPVADVPLTEIFDTVNSVLIDDYLVVLKTYISQQLEDTIWLDDQSTTPLFDAGFATFHRKPDGTVQSLRKPALQCLIERTIRDRPNVTNPIGVKAFDTLPDPDLQTPSTISLSTHGPLRHWRVARRRRTKRSTRIPDWFIGNSIIRGSTREFSFISGTGRDQHHPPFHWTTFARRRREPHSSDPSRRTQLADRHTRC